MTKRKARTAIKKSNTDSPVVSDDDGIDLPRKGSVDDAPVHRAHRFVAFPEADAERISDKSSLSSEEVYGHGKHGNRHDRDHEDSGQDSGSDEEHDEQPEVVDAGEESDSSTDGDANPIGDVPIRWYDGYDHIGYDRSGEKIIPKNRPSALELAADKHAWRRIYDEKNDEEIVLTHDELKTIARLRAGYYPDSQFDDQNELIAWSGPIRKTPLTAGHEPKRRFLPSRHEARLVVRLVKAMREGRMTRPSERKGPNSDELADYSYDIWEGHEPKTLEEMSKSEKAREIMRLPAPKVPLPRHDESYNPPAEYLPTQEERAEWEQMDPEDRATNYLPTKQDALRHVPLYDNFIKERFERCLDLYLAVRIRKDPERMNPEELVPKLPSPRDLRPFPSGRVLSYDLLPARARSIDVHPGGQWLLSGSDDGCVRLWEVATGYLRCTWNLGQRVGEVDGKTQPVMCVSWRPREQGYVFGAAVGNSLFIVSASKALGRSDIEAEVAMEQPKEKADDEGSSEEIQWRDHNAREDNDADAMSRGATGVDNVEDLCHLIEVQHPRPLRNCTWHRKGDYVSTVGKDSSGGTVAVHRLSRRSSRILFRRKSSAVQCVRFHPSRPFFFVATMHHVRIYNLALEQAVKVLKPGVRWISSIDIHSSGDHVLVTSYDKRTCWFDLDLSVRPYRTIRNHEKAVRTAKFHARLPLFADAADDGAIHVFHGMAYDDLTKNALIVPLKTLNGYHTIVDSLGVLDISWHPRLPWLFSSGADGKMHLFTDVS